LWQLMRRSTPRIAECAREENIKKDAALRSASSALLVKANGAKLRLLAQPAQPANTPDPAPKSANAASRDDLITVLVVQSASAVRLASMSIVLELMAVSSASLADTPAAVARQSVQCAALAKQASALHFHVKSA
jgi:hypothetical protein